MLKGVEQQLNKEITRLVRICCKKNIVPILTEDGNVAVYRFSLSSQSKKMFEKIRYMEQVIRVYSFGVDSKVGNERCEEIGLLLRSDFPDIKCVGGFESDITKDVYKALKHLGNSDAEKKHVKNIGIIGTKNPIIPKNLDELIFALNGEYRFKYSMDSISRGDESKLYLAFGYFFRRPYLDFLINMIYEYLNYTKITNEGLYSYDYYRHMKKDFLEVLFNDKEKSVSDKVGFVSEIIKSLDIKLLGVCSIEKIDKDYFKSVFGYTCLNLVYDYAKHNSDVIASSKIFENVTFPEDIFAKSIGSKK